MARRTKDAEAKKQQEVSANGETIILWKVKRPLSEAEHEILANRIRVEEEHTGVKIMLVPYSVDAETQISVDDTGGTSDHETQTLINDAGGTNE